MNEECLWSIFLHLSGAGNGYDVDMNPSRKPSPTESPLLFEIDDEPLLEALNAWGSVPLVVQAFRSLGVPARVRQHGVVSFQISPRTRWVRYVAQFYGRYKLSMIDKENAATIWNG